MAIEPFQLHDNLMLVGGIAASGGCLIAEVTAVVPWPCDPTPSP
jgi:hypothetical protein